MLKFIIAPILGGIIGYITNDLAIKMLFRPRKSVYIGKYHVPFTPGLIPQQKSRIAKSIGKVISEQLLNADTLKSVILSPKTLANLRLKVTSFLNSMSEDARTIAEILELHFTEAQIQDTTTQVERKAAEVISAKISEANVGQIVVDSGVQALLESENVNRFASLLLDTGIQTGIQKKLAEKINQMVEEKAPDIIYGELEKNKNLLLETRVCEIYSHYQEKQEQAVDYIMTLYSTLLGDNLEKLLQAVNLEKIVVSKINSFDAEQLEAMIFGIMKRELKAIVYLGALLGFFMGFINLLF